MKVLSLTTLVAMILTLTSSLTFARGHDTPDRYEWEAQLEQVKQQDRNPSSQREPVEIEWSERFKEHYSKKEE